jgi:urease accessory protein
MSAAALPFEARSRAAAEALSPIRVHGGVQVAFAACDGTTRLKELSERGGYRLRFPHTHAAHAEAVIINTGGGVVSGDAVTFDVAVGGGANAVVTTQSAERIYTSAAPWSRLDVGLTIASGARLAWLPQETILFSGARLKRRFEIDVAADASALLVESLVFGRIASGETMTGGAIHDIWRIRRDGQLVFAEANRLDDVSADTLARPAVLRDARAMAFMFYMAPHAEALLDPLREVLESAGSEAGVSAWNGALVVRILARDPQAMRRDVIRVIERISSAPPPRVWLM